MLIATKVRLYPTAEQRRFLNGQFGAVRFCYNKAVALKRDYYRKKGISLSVIKEIKPLLSVAKGSRKYNWLAQYDSISLQEAVRHADTAYKRFFKKQGRFPQFKSKRSKQSSYHCTGLTVGDNFIKIAKCGPIKAVIHRSIPGEVKSITVCRDRVGDYFASILCETAENIPTGLTEVEESKVLGIDLGIKDFLTDSLNRTVDNPKELGCALKELKKAHKAVSRKKKGSVRRSKAVKRLAKVYRKVSRRREDFQHKVSKRLVDENQAIIAESLQIKNMVHNRKLSRAIADAGWGGFLSKLGYKAERSGKLFIQTDTFFPSSKRCPHCQFKFDGLTLSMRQWKCPQCGSLNLRDYAAAINIMREGIVQMKAAGLAVLRR